MERKNIRLRGYDYSTPGFYFITICTDKTIHRFGKIDPVDMTMKLNGMGRIVEYWWYKLEAKFEKVKCREMVIMPNHIHCIIELVGADLCVRPLEQNSVSEGGHVGPPLHSVIQWFKTMTTNSIIRYVQSSTSGRYSGKLWQRNYYEHIIRDGNEHSRIIDYIEKNPVTWINDRYNI